MTNVLEVRNLRTQFQTEHGLVTAVDGVSFDVREKEIVGVVGESGCGKSVTQLSVMQLVKHPGKVVGGEVMFEGHNLLEYSAVGPEMRAVRGAKIAMVFQEPMTSLNPTLTVGDQLTEMMKLHLHMDKKAARNKAAELLHLVGIPSASSRLDDYPHQLSGGMRQRVMIAIALSCNPKLIIADEPTTALDATTQAQLLELMKQLVDSFNTSLIIITHNLGVVARYAQRIYIMYAGRIVESGTTKEIFANPHHPYTKGLLSCVPRLDGDDDEELTPIPGMPPNLSELRTTCAFYPRCSYHREKCGYEPWPDLITVGLEHQVACGRYANEQRYPG